LQKFLARQPIFDSHRIVFGYELLFRSSIENFFPNAQPDVAAASTADNLFLFGAEELTHGRRAFINCTREFIVRDFPALLPKDRVVIEVLENEQIDEQLVDACRTLKRAGYLFALDDFRDTPEWQPLLPLTDFIKVDVLATPADEQFRLAKKFEKSGIRLVAEKVEDYDVFERTLCWGYTYFQGYFFSRPQMLTRHDIPANKLNYLLVLQAANRSRIDLNEVAERIKAETSLSYRLLRYLNSPVFALISDVHSIPHALALLGERGVRKWISLIAIAAMGADKPQELLVLPLIRARLCELLAPWARLHGSADDLFLLGLLSSIDAILDMTMENVLKEIVLGRELHDALLGHDNPLRQVLDVAVLYETGSWDKLEEAAARLRIDPKLLPDRFIEAVGWAQRILTGQRAEESSEGETGVRTLADSTGDQA
jgi:EAL and modified HD-GYP domain-containing signal transduction protein